MWVPIALFIDNYHHLSITFNHTMPLVQGSEPSASSVSGLLLERHLSEWSDARDAGREEEWARNAAFLLVSAHECSVSYW